MVRPSKGSVAVIVATLLAAMLGFGAGALLHNPTSLGYLSNVGTVLLAAIPALAAYVRSGKIQSETTEIKTQVEAVREQTNGTTSTLVDVTGRAVDALAAIANDPAARQRAAGLLRTIEAGLPDQPRDEPTEPPGTVPPAVPK